MLVYLVTCGLRSLFIYMEITSCAPCNMCVFVCFFLCLFNLLRFGFNLIVPLVGTPSLHSVTLTLLIKAGSNSGFHYQCFISEEFLDLCAIQHSYRLDLYFRFPGFMFRRGWILSKKLCLMSRSGFPDLQVCLL